MGAKNRLKGVALRAGWTPQQLNELLLEFFEEKGEAILEGATIEDRVESFLIRKVAEESANPKGIQPRAWVRWEIDVYANDPTSAALMALEAQRDPTSIASVFEVCVNSRLYRVDLALPGAGEVELSLNNIHRCPSCGSSDIIGLDSVWYAELEEEHAEGEETAADLLEWTCRVCARAWWV